jgi:hypothetical protein
VIRALLAIVEAPSEALIAVGIALVLIGIVVGVGVFLLTLFYWE